MSDALWSAVIGAVTATAGVSLIELVWKPARARQRAAAMILTEVQLNSRLLASIKKSREDEPGRVADTVVMSTRGWAAVADEVHHLPSALVGTLLLRYGQFDEINLLARNYSHKVDLLLPLERGSPKQQALFSEIQSDEKVFGAAVEAVLGECPRTIAKLQAVVDAGPPSL